MAVIKSVYGIENKIGKIDMEVMVMAGESYYYNQLNKVQQAVYHAMKNGLQALAPSFQVPLLEGREAAASPRRSSPHRGGGQRLSGPGAAGGTATSARHGPDKASIGGLGPWVSIRPAPALSSLGGAATSVSRALIGAVAPIAGGAAGHTAPALLSPAQIGQAAPA